MTKGSCLCGGVKFEIHGRLTALQYCHCSRCRKANGSAFQAAVACKAERFQWISGEDLVQVYEAPMRETPPPYRTAFCRRCGSPVPLVRPGQRFVVIAAGILDEHPPIEPLRHIFVAKKSPWYEIRDGLPQFEAHEPPEQRLPTT